MGPLSLHHSENASFKAQNSKIQETPKAAIYVRVSTEEQAKEGFSLQAQEEALVNYAKALGYEIYKVYRDEGISAKDLKRPALQRLLKDASEKKFDAIFIYKLDRFSRSLRDLILTIDKLKEWNIDFISLQDKIETASASGKLMFHIISAFAEFERDLISERTSFGMSKRAETGKIVNRAPFGYKYVEGNLAVDNEKAKKVREMFEDFVYNGYSLRRLSEKYGFSVPGVKKILQNETYLGKVKYKGKVIEGSHEAIISEELFRKAQEKLRTKWDQFKIHYNFPYGKLLLIRYNQKQKNLIKK